MKPTWCTIYSQCISSILFITSTYFGLFQVHHQEEHLYLCNTWYLLFWQLAVWCAGIQVLHKYRCSSWWWTWRGPKHVHSFHWHVQNSTIPCRYQELLPFLSFMYIFLPPFPTNYSSILSHPILPSISWSNLSILLFPDSYIILFCEFYFLPFSVHVQTNVICLTLLSLLYEGWNFNSGNYLFTTDTK